MKELPPIDLTEFDPPFGCSEYEWGPPVPLPDYPESPLPPGGLWQDHAFHVEILSWHYHDYMGTHAYVQVWDYRQQLDPDQRWQMMLLLHCPKRTLDEDGCIIGTDWRWVIRKEYEQPWSQGGPRHAEVGADIDTWIAAPDELRFILE